MTTGHRSVSPKSSSSPSSTFANNRVHEVTGKVPALVFENIERRLLRPLGEAPFDTDDVESAGVTKSFRVRFDRNLYSVPPRLVGQSVVIRANDDAVAVFLGPRQVALHRRSWDVGQDIEQPAHREAALAKKPRAAAGDLPPALTELGEVGRRYFKVLAAGSRSIHREIARLTLLVELFGESATSTASPTSAATTGSPNEPATRVSQRARTRPTKTGGHHEGGRCHRSPG